NGKLVSENMHIADRTIFASEDGGTVGIPIVIENGELKLRVGRIDTAYFNQFISTNGKLIMRGYDNFADIRIFR
ncbi:hypothetical protein R0K05_23030, partial [Planococcus sp. SIMBA_160]